MSNELKYNDNQIFRNVKYLTDLEFCHSINKRSGKIKLVEGPKNFSFLYRKNHIIINKTNKIVLKEDQYMIIINPYDLKQKRILFGKKEIRKGPCTFSLRPEEQIDISLQSGLETFRGKKIDGIKYDSRINNIPTGSKTINQPLNGIRYAYILKKNKGLLVKAIEDFVDEDNIQRTAGEEWVIKGEKKYFPHKYVLVKRKVKAFSLGIDEGIYIKNINTGEIRSELGPKFIMLNHEDELHNKFYTETELKALKIRGYASSFDFTKVLPLYILQNEVAMIMEVESQRIVFGPKKIMLGPFERPKIMKVSGGTPKSSEKSVLIWSIRLGPNYSSDIVNARTQDNAEVKINIRYKWRFQVLEDSNNEGLNERIFDIPDFIGLATETMASILRDEAAKHDFEELHKGAVEIFKKKIFGEDYRSFIFNENGFEIFDIDIKSIEPTDPETAEKMHNAIKENMDGYVEKIKTKTSSIIQQEKIKLDIETEEKREKLIQKQLSNQKIKQEGETGIEIKRRTELLKMEIKEIEDKKNIENNLEIQKIKDTMSLLEDKNVDKYLKLQEIKSLENTKKTLILPTNSKLNLHIGNMDNKFIEDED